MPHVPTDRYMIMDAVSNGVRPTIENISIADAPPGFVNLMHRSWAQEPSDRPGFDEINMILDDMQNARYVVFERAKCENVTCHTYESTLEYTFEQISSLEHQCSNTGIISEKMSLVARLLLELRICLFQSKVLNSLRDEIPLL